MKSGSIKVVKKLVRVKNDAVDVTGTMRRRVTRDDVMRVFKTDQFKFNQLIEKEKKVFPPAYSTRRPQSGLTELTLLQDNTYTEEKHTPTVTRRCRSAFVRTTAGGPTGAPRSLQQQVRDADVTSHAGRVRGRRKVKLTSQKSAKTLITDRTLLQPSSRTYSRYISTFSDSARTTQAQAQRLASEDGDTNPASHRRTFLDDLDAGFAEKVKFSTKSLGSL